MKRSFLLIGMLLIAVMMMADNYTALWKEVERAAAKDLPQNQLQVLTKITHMAQRDKAYGHLLKAQLYRVQLMITLSEDSVNSELKHLELQERKAAQNPVLQAVYDVVLSKLYAGAYAIDSNTVIAKRYEAKAVSHPEALGAATTSSYVPVISERPDSKIYNNDMLSVIGRALERYDVMLTYYEQQGNRQAACYTAYELIKHDKYKSAQKQSDSVYIHRLDSVINIYKDLPICGEVAIERLHAMRQMSDVSPRQCVDYINYAKEQWKTWKRIESLDKDLDNLTKSMFTAKIANQVIPSQHDFKLYLSQIRNLTSVTIKLYRTALDGTHQYWRIGKKEYKELKSHLTPLPVYTQTITWKPRPAYEVFDDSLLLKGLDYGVYLIAISSKAVEEPVYMLLSVSDLTAISLGLPDKKMRIVVLNTSSGKPVQGAQIRLERKPYGQPKVTTTLYSNKDGEVIYTTNGDVRLYVSKGKDIACREQWLQYNYGFTGVPDDDDVMWLFTDRAIYRPGQTVHVAGILSRRSQGVNLSTISNRKVTLRLYDVNNQLVGSKEMITDRYGSCAADFILPKHVLSGIFRIETDNAAIFISVEEYKRPSFTVDIAKVETAYKAGDTLTVTAKSQTYSGIPVQHARVKYSVVRKVAYWWLAYSRYWSGGTYGKMTAQEEVYRDSTVTDESGHFTARMPLIVPVESETTQFYNYVLTAEVTDSKGETHRGELAVYLGTRPSILSSTLADKVLTDSVNTFVFNRINAGGNPIAGQVSYHIDDMPVKTVDAGHKVTLPVLKQGEHTLYAVCEQDTLKYHFIVFGLNDTKPAITTHDWFYQSASQFPRDNSAVTIQVGASDPDLHLVYAIIADDKIVEQGQVKRNGELVNLKLKYKASYGSGVLVSYAWVKEGVCYHHTVFVAKPLPDYHLTLRWETFRNRLVPGQQEQWVLQVADKNNRPADAQLMATLYDKSLDVIRPNEWAINPQLYSGETYTGWVTQYWNGMEMSTSFSKLIFNVPVMLNFSRLEYLPNNLLGYRLSGRIAGLALTSNLNTGIRLRGAAPMKKKESAIKMVGQLDVAEAKNEVLMSAKDGDLTGNSDDNRGRDMVRTNLQETAFFYPALTTDGEGRVRIQFTLPESLTTWRFLGLAHTADMNWGSITGETVAQKQLMLQPNMPRYVRAGDKATITSSVYNNTDKHQEGKVSLALIDAATDKTVYQTSKEIAVDSNATADVTFQLPQLTVATPMLITRIYVETAQAKDGEQHYLPVLPSEERVTVTRPFTQTDAGIKHVDIDEMIPAGTTAAKLTVEYTNTPVWLMMQALPVMAEPQNENAASIAAAYYADAIGKQIADSNPKLQQIFRMWADDSVSLSSALEQNQELKDILLAETPWVLDADNENEQKHRLIDFFDANTMNTRLNDMATKLANLQNTDGSWSWWKGMRGSWLMTVEISEMLTRLSNKTGSKPEMISMLDKAHQYMDKEVVRIVNELKAEKARKHTVSFPSYAVLQYMYLCKLDGRKLPAATVRAIEYLKPLLRKDIQRQTIYEKAMSAIVLNDIDYINSLKQYTVYKEDIGRYYDTYKAPYSWKDYRIPTQVAAIEAIQRLTPDDKKTIKEMKQWLLYAKQVQAWDTPINSVNAIYAFLYGEPQTLVLGQEPAKLMIDGKAIAHQAPTAALGYVKTTVSKDNAHRLTIEKTSQGTSWGAVYAQFYQSSNQVKQQGNGFQIKREIIGGHQSAYAVGERVKIRITVTADRDYDFVQIQDKRAACMEPVQQLSGYQQGYYAVSKDNVTHYYFDRMAKGRHVIETDYYIDRKGEYQMGTCTVSCAYSAAFRGTYPGETLIVK